MRPDFSFFLVVMFILLFVLPAGAQTCSGSLGAPVINETFGAGTTFGVGPPLPNGITTLQYNGDICGGDDGTYTLLTSMGSSCKGATWQTINHDHTGDKNGYMMIINAAIDPSVFFTYRVQGNKLCPNTTYQFAAWIMNILRDLPKTQGYSQPNITFRIETPGGKILKTYNTGDIPASIQPVWQQYGTFFTSPSDGSDVIVKMINNGNGGNGNDLALDDITFSPCGPLIQTGFTAIGDTISHQQCVNQSLSYTLVSAQAGYDHPTYQWQQNLNDGNGWTDIAGETTATLKRQLNNPAAGTFQYRLGILNGNNTSINCRIYSDPLNIYIRQYPVVDILTTTVICEGRQLRLHADGGDTYQWSGPNGFASMQQYPVVDNNSTPADNGNYTVAVTSGGCTSFASTAVQVFPNVITVVSNNTSICQGDVTTLSAAQSTGGVYYKWTPATGLDHDDQATVHASPAQTTTYSVKVSNDGCYNDARSVTVTVIKKPVANAGKNISVREGEFTKLSGTAAGDSISYYWTPSGYLDDPTSLTPVTTPVDNITYTLHVLSHQNCGEATSNVNVRVLKNITIPNTFTPNNDGINDYWNIRELNTYPESLVLVFDRSGQKVYQSTGYSKPWNGNMNYDGQPLPPGTYYYVIDLKNNIPKISGWVMIFR
ncbi:MAG: gliding motility-associated C-terminal domain-containing protein [Bacteroidota bacterium]|nr:gliding motility-associated C-terminal domain-containing protein [Bacteroidota bacterium]